MHPFFCWGTGFLFVAFSLFGLDEVKRDWQTKGARSRLLRGEDILILAGFCLLLWWGFPSYPKETGFFRIALAVQALIRAWQYSWYVVRPAQEACRRAKLEVELGEFPRVQDEIARFRQARKEELRRRLAK